MALEVAVFFKGKEDEGPVLVKLLQEALDLTQKEQSEYSEAVLCNVETLLQNALVDVQGAAYAVYRALSQLGCSAGDSDLCEKLFEANHLVAAEVNDEL